MDKVLIDSNVILDIALARHPFFDASSAFLRLAAQKRIRMFVTATTVTDLYYIIRKAFDHLFALNFLTELLEIMEVAGVDKGVIMRALSSEMEDFEDAVQVSTAVSHDISFIVTRNIRDFDQVEDIKALTPEQAITLLGPSST